MNNTIEEALKIAVVDAFFTSKTYYDSNGNYKSYGGYLQNVVEKIVNQMPILELSELVCKELLKEENRIVLVKQLNSKMYEMFGGSYSNMNLDLKTAIQSTIAKCINESEDLQKKLLGNLNIENKHIQITVTISDKK